MDNGKYTNFVKDSAGYGLAQWTFWSRKQNLLNYAKQKKSSIGDLNMQLEFLMQELTNSYPKVLNLLKTAKSVREASDAVLLQFERPADQSTAVQEKRAAYGEKYYNEYAAKEVKLVYSNSPLVNYTKISPNKTSPRNHAIDTITIHCVVGQVTAERLGEIFAPSSRQASSNYGVDKDGRIGMYVEEKDRSWCTSSSSNDNRAITIEVASDTVHPYAVTDKAYNALIKLVADICKRNNIKELKWQADKSLIGQVDKQNMTVHRWFANKSCPGEYLYSRHGDIANQVNKLLGVTSSTTSVITPVVKEPTLVEGQVIKLKKGATYHNGVSIPNWVLNSTLYYRGKNNNGIIFSTQKTGAITGVVKASALDLPEETKPVTPSTPVVTPTPAPSTSTTTKEPTFVDGQVIKLKSNATYHNGVAIPKWVLNSTLYYRGENNSGIIFSTQKTGAITGVVKLSAIDLPEEESKPAETKPTTTTTPAKPATPSTPTTTTKPSTSTSTKPLVMSVEDFDALMTAWLTEQAKKDPGAWSEEAREWCEKNGIINGDANGNRMYKKLLTREELAAIVYRLHK